MKLLNKSIVMSTDVHICQTANIDYRLSFANQGKQTSVFCFPFVENKQKFTVSVYRLYKA
jgi:hypothetical protein